VDQQVHPFEQAGEAEVARQLGHPSTVRVRGAAGEVDAAVSEVDEEEHVEAARVSVSTVKKSQASMVAAYWRRNCCQLGPARLGAGPRRWASRIRLAVLGDTRRPSLSSSPAIRG
jgi:hypothetical protein